MAQMRNVSGTAFVVAEYRSEENDAARPLYRDTIVNLLLNDESRQAAARAAVGFPLVKEMVKIRTRYYDDMLEQQIAAGCRQVVLLGAGLDTRAIRKSAPHVAYFEIDDAETLALKQACFEHHGLSADVEFIGGNYVTEGLVNLLSKSRFDPDLPTYVIWEGNTMYLPFSGNVTVMEELRDTVSRFRVSFDYFAQAMIAKATGEPGLTQMVENFASMDAPWITGFDNIEALADEVELKVIDNVTTGELHRRYRPDATAAPAFGPYYSICTLGSR